VVQETERGLAESRIGQAAKHMKVYEGWGTFPNPPKYLNSLRSILPNPSDQRLPDATIQTIDPYTYKSQRDHQEIEESMDD